MNHRIPLLSIAALVCVISYFGLYGMAYAQTSSTVSSNSPFLTRPITLGSEGDDVRQLQQYLLANHYDDAIAVTGVFDAETLHGAAEFQRAHGLEGLGYVGPATRALINSLVSGGATDTQAILPTSTLQNIITAENTAIATSSSAASQPKEAIVPVPQPAVSSQAPLPPSSIVFARPLTLGSEGADVIYLQFFLKSRGMFLLYPTGYFGPITLASVESFQEAAGLKPIGYVGPSTRMLLNTTYNSQIVQAITTNGSLFKDSNAESSHSGGGFLASSPPIPTDTSTSTTTTTTDKVQIPPDDSAPPGSATTTLETVSLTITPRRFDSGSSGTLPNITIPPAPPIQPPVPVVDTTPPVISAVVSNAGITTATISWVTNEPGISEISYGLDASYGGHISDPILTTTHSLTISGITPATLYHFQVSSTDAAGNVSVSSGDVTFTTLPAADITPPAVSAIISSPLATTAAITWSTNEPASSVLEYGLDSNYGSTMPITTFDLNHTSSLSGLLATSTYHFRITATDASGNQTITGDNTFTTTDIPDTTPPSIANVAATASSTSAVISWVTNEATTDLVEYGQTLGYGSSQSSSALLTSHSLQVAGLTPQTGYHFRITSTDASGNATVGTDNAFITLAMPDITPPTVAITAPTEGATVSGTSTPATATASDTVSVADVQFKIDGVNVQAAITTSPYTITLDTTAFSDGTHTLTAVARDPSGNIGVSSPISIVIHNSVFVAPQPPLITSIVSSSTNTSATITWTTNENATSNVSYGTTISYGSASSTAALSTLHHILLSGLTASTTYHYQIQSADGVGTVGTSSDQTFSTTAALDTIAPTVGLAAPLNGASVSGSFITLTATSSDNVAVTGVQFTVDGTNVGPSGTSSPYTYQWNSLSVTDGSHIVGVVALDAAGNRATSTPATITVDNTGPVVSGIASSTTQNGATITWTTNESAHTVLSYGLTSSYGIASSTPANSTSHTTILSGLNAGSVYHFQIVSIDAQGNTSTTTDQTLKTTAAPDVTPPTVSITLPAASSTVSNNATVSAVATDTVAVAGVQFLIDGMNLASEATSSPYSIVWNTTTATNGIHLLSAVARDTSGNIATSSSVSVTVNNVIASSTLSFSSETAPFGLLSMAGAPVITVASTSAPVACSFASSTPYFLIDNSCNVTLAAAGVGALSSSAPYVLPVSITTATASGTEMLTINGIPNQYDVGTTSQLMTILGYATSTLSGKTVALHRGSYSQGVPIFIFKPGMTATFTMKKSDVESVMPRLEAITLRDTSNITLDGLYVQMTSWPKAQASVIYIEDGGDNIVIKNSKIRHGYGTNNADIDPTFEYPDYTEATTSPNWGMAGKLAYGIERDGSGTSNNLTITDNTLTDVSNAIKVTPDTGLFQVVGNTMSRVYSDFISGGNGSPNPPSINVAWNVMTLPFGLGSDNQGYGPHPDSFQLSSYGFTATTSPSTWRNITIEGNIYYTGTYNGKYPRGFSQGIPYFDDMPDGKYYEGVMIRGNLDLTHMTSHGADVTQSKNTYYFGNTSVEADPYDPGNQHPQTVILGGTAAGWQVVANSVTDSIVRNPTVSVLNSYELGLSGALIPYENMFVGPTFSPTSVSDALREFAPKPGGPLANGVIGAVGNGYVDFANRIIHHEMEVSFVHFDDVTDQPVSTLVVSTTSVVHGGVDGRSIAVSGLGSPQYRLCADELCTTVVTNWTSSTSTVNVNQWLQLRFMTPSTNSTSQTATVTINGTSYTFTARTVSAAPYTSVIFHGNSTITPPTLTATVTSGVVTGVTIQNGGINYVLNRHNILSFTGTASTTATGYAVDTNGDGVLDSVTITSGGSGYASAPVVGIPDVLVKAVGSLNQTPDNATVTATVSNGGIASYTIANGGAHYEPGVHNAIFYSGGGGTGALGYAVDTNGDGVLDYATSTSVGTGYTSSPTLTIDRNIQHLIFAMRVNPANAEAGNTYLSSAKLIVSQIGNNAVRIQVQTPTGNSTIERIDSQNGLTQNTYQTLLCTLDFTATITDGYVCYNDNTRITPVNTSTWTQAAQTSFSNGSTPAWSIGSNTTGTGGWFEGGLQFMYFAYGTAAIDSATGRFLDITDPAVRDRFTVDGISTADGTGPTGKQPQMFFTGPASDWNNGLNKGSGGNFSMTSGAVQ